VLELLGDHEIVGRAAVGLGDQLERLDERRKGVGRDFAEVGEREAAFELRERLGGIGVERGQAVEPQPAP
jgi:hypothetical protein